jgi:hypothetical protein
MAVSERVSELMSALDDVNPSKRRRRRLRALAPPRTIASCAISGSASSGDVLQQEATRSVQHSSGVAASQASQLYPPLDRSTRQIRLLSLCEEIGDHIACKISVFSLSDFPQFIALSYVWGPPDVQHEIILNGQPFSIRYNLYSALKSISEHIRSARGEAGFPHGSPTRAASAIVEIDRFKTRTTSPFSGHWEYFWIDAICINQTRISERNHQVRLMSDIYKSATFVLVWLGLQCEQALDLLATAEPSDVRAVFEPCTDRFRRSKFSEPLIPFLRSDYWSRMWIVQEFVLATNIVFASGSVLADWEKVNPLFPHIYAYRSSGDYSLAITLVNERRQHEFRHTHGIRADLHELVQRFGLMECSDLRDRVFALYGLMKEDSGDSHDLLLVDYSLTPAQLSVRVLRLAGISIKHEQGLEKLHEWLKSALEIDLIDPETAEELAQILEEATNGEEIDSDSSDDDGTWVRS